MIVVPLICCARTRFAMIVVAMAVAHFFLKSWTDIVVPLIVAGHRLS